jgi:heme exporter protein CcmD
MLARLAGYGPYVWGAYALFGFALIAELWMLVLARRAVRRRIAQARLVNELAARERVQGQSGEAPA